MDIDGQASQQPFQTLAGATMGMINSDRDLLHNYIYDYLIKQNYLDSAKIFYKEGEVTSSKKTTRLIRNSSIKQSSSPSSNSGEPNSSHPQPSNSTGPDPSTNNDASVVNGVSTTSSTSSTPRPFSSQDPSRSNPSINGNSANRPSTKENDKNDVNKDIEELPSPDIAVDSPQGFLFEWWTIFWDLYSAKGLKGGSPAAQHYVQNSMRLRQEQARQAQLQQQQQQHQQHQQQQQQHPQPGQPQQHPNQLPQHQNPQQLPHQLTSQQIQQQPGLIQQPNNGMSFVGPNGQLVNYGGFLNMNPQHAAMVNGSLIQTPIAAGQLPENMTEAEKRNFAARQAMYRRNMAMPTNPAQMQQIQQQMYQQRQQQLQAQVQAQQQQQQQQGGPQHNPQQKQQPPQPQQQPQPQPQPQPQSQPQPQPQPQPQQVRLPMNPNGPQHPRPNPQGQTPQPSQNPQAQSSNNASPVPHAHPQGPHMGPHRNSPAVEDANASSHSPTPQTGSPSKRQRLSPQGSYVATGGHINGNQMVQNMPNQPVMVNPGVNNGQFNPQFNPAMLQVKGAMPNGMPQQFPAGMMTAQQRQNMMNMGPGKMSAQPVVTPGGTQIPGNSPMAMTNEGMAGQNGMVDYANRQQAGQRNLALQDYQNQLMQLERVNQQRLTDSSSGNGGQPGPQRSLSTGGANQGQFKQAGQGRPAASASPALTNADIPRRGTPQISKQQQPPVSPLTDIHGQPPPPHPQQLPQGPHRNSPNVANNGFAGNMIQGPNGTMVSGPPAAGGGPQGMWQGQPSQAQSPRIQQRRSPSQPMASNQQPPAQSPAAGHNASPAMMQANSHQMPPPNGPISAIDNKTQPSSPALGNPPTPTQSHKQVNKGKKDVRDTAAKKRGKKGNPATPVGTSEPPTPPTPATPHNPATNGASSNPANAMMASSNTPSSSGSTGSNKPGNAVAAPPGNNSKDEKNSNENAKGEEQITDTVMFNAPRQGVSVNGPNNMGGMNSGVNMGGLDLTAAGGPVAVTNGGFLEPTFLDDFGGTEGDVADIDFDFNTFLNEDGTSSGLNFDSTSAFNWTEGVETGNE